MRAIIRFSVDNETNGALRNKLTAVLEGAGFVRNPHVTATYEHADIAEKPLGAAMQEFWRQANNHEGEATIDHVWMYADNPPPSGN